MGEPRSPQHLAEMLARAEAAVAAEAERLRAIRSQLQGPSEAAVQTENPMREPAPKASALPTIGTLRAGSGLARTGVGVEFPPSSTDVFQDIAFQLQMTGFDSLQNLGTNYEFFLMLCG